MKSCPHCDACQDNIGVSFEYDGYAEYAHYTCMYCGWEWSDASIIDWHFNDNDLLAVGMA